MTAARSRSSGILDWKGILGIALSVGLLYWALRRVDFAQVVNEMRQAHIGWFVLSVVCATLVFPLRAWRWKPLLDPSAPNTSFRGRYAATTIGFMGNNLLPARMGEFMRAYALARQEKTSALTAFASLVTERLFDAVAVVSLLFVATALPAFPDVERVGGYNFSAMARSMGVVVAALMLIALALVLWPRRTVHFFEKYVTRYLPQKVRRPLVDAMEALLAGLSSLRSPYLLALLSLQTLIIWLINAAGFYLAFLAFDIHVPFAGALFIQSVIALFVSLPSAPGFFGLYETAAQIVLVELFLVDVNKAMGFALGYHIGGFIPITLIGLYYAWKVGLSWREVGKSEEVVEEAVERELPPPEPT